MTKPEKVFQMDKKKVLQTAATWKLGVRTTIIIPYSV